MSNDRADAAFRELHAAGRLLVLANAWDAASARLIEECGAAAIATTSAGLAWSHGYADGGKLPPRVLAAAVAEIARVIRVPLSVDAEGGYSDDPKEVAQTITALMDAGAVGINLEDGSESPELLCTKIAAVRAAAERAGVDLFVNARTDVYLRGLASGALAIDEVVARAARYREAGCDGIFVPKVVEPDAIRTLAAAIAPLPLNVLAMPGLADTRALAELGVRRVSAGSAIAQATLGVARRLATGFLQTGRSDDLFGGAAEYLTMNKLLSQS